MSKAIVLRGPYTVAELKRFADLMREIEQTRPKELFSLTVIDLDDKIPLEEMEKVVRDIFPRVPGEGDRAVWFGSWRRR